MSKTVYQIKRTMPDYEYLLPKKYRSMAIAQRVCTNWNNISSYYHEVVPVTIANRKKRNASKEGREEK